MTKSQISKLMSDYGSRGRGAAKRRGSAEYYSRISKARWDKKKSAEKAVNSEQ